MAKGLDKCEGNIRILNKNIQYQLEYSSGTYSFFLEKLNIRKENFKNLIKISFENALKYISQSKTGRDILNYLQQNWKVWKIRLNKMSPKFKPPQGQNKMIVIWNPFGIGWFIDNRKFSEKDDVAIKGSSQLIIGTISPPAFLLHELGHVKQYLEKEIESIKKRLPDNYVDEIEALNLKKHEKPFLKDLRRLGIVECIRWDYYHFYNHKDAFAMVTLNWEPIIVGGVITIKFVKDGKNYRPSLWELSKSCKIVKKELVQTGEFISIKTYIEEYEKFYKKFRKNYKDFYLQYKKFLEERRVFLKKSYKEQIKFMKRYTELLKKYKNFLEYCVKILGQYDHYMLLENYHQYYNLYDAYINLMTGYIQFSKDYKLYSKFIVTNQNYEEFYTIYMLHKEFVDRYKKITKQDNISLEEYYNKTSEKQKKLSGKLSEKEIQHKKSLNTCKEFFVQYIKILNESKKDKKIFNSLKPLRPDMSHITDKEIENYRKCMIKN